MEKEIALLKEIVKNQQEVLKNQQEVLKTQQDQIAHLGKLSQCAVYQHDFAFDRKEPASTLHGINFFDNFYKCKGCGAVGTGGLIGP